MSAVAAVAVGGLVGGMMDAANSEEEKAGPNSLTRLDKTAGVAICASSSNCRCAVTVAAMTRDRDGRGGAARQ